jgi:ribosomal protein S18 acetylase RimI-like enzyme
LDIRELTSAERSQAVALWDACGLTRPWNPPEADFDRAVAGPTSAVLGMVGGDRVASTVMVGHDGHRGWVYYLAVDPSVRGQDLGRRMMRAAEEWLTIHGAVKVQLMVRATNSQVLAFYERVGYSPEEVTVMSRWLD